MAAVEVLIEGYVKDGGSTVQATVTLVRDNGHNIVVDPGMTHDPRAIAEALKKHALLTDDIDTVFITHHHPDHTRYMGLFQGARVYDYNSFYASDRWVDIGDGHLITRNVKILRTPGHTNEDATLVVSEVTNIPAKSSCVVAITHLWWFEGKEDDPMAENIQQLHKSRAMVLDVADFIIPGHGGTFAVKK